MICREIRERLDDFVDGDLPRREAEAVRRHLNQCSTCKRQEVELRDLLAEARSLPGLAPDRDLWTGIEARLRTETWTARFAHFRQRHRFLEPLLWAAAVGALVAVSTPFLRQSVEPNAGPVAASPPYDAGMQGAELAALARLEDGTLSVRRDLLEAVAVDSAVLEPATLAVVESDLREIDAAIGEIRAALEAHPDNPHLSFLLASRYQQEVVLLKQLIGV